jgi:hypothetical protein
MHLWNSLTKKSKAIKGWLRILKASFFAPFKDFFSAFGSSSIL